jgi:hypothetical protein
LPTSSEPAINATGIAEAAKIAISPTIENHAAIKAIAIAVAKVIIGNNIIFSFFVDLIRIYLLEKENNIISLV